MIRTQGLLRLAAVAALVIVAFAMQDLVSNGGGAAPSLSAITAAEGSKAETTVRIAAKRWPSGNTEYRLQVRMNGEWGERIAPHSRSFSARTGVGQWRSGSALELDSGHFVRISAQRLTSGQIEFALQEQVDDEWGERMLPEIRLLPSDPPVDTWLYSSELTLRPSPRFAPVVDVSGWASATVQYSSSFDQGGVQTWVRGSAAEGELQLLQACRNSEDVELQIEGLSTSAESLVVMSENGSSGVEVSVTIDDGKAESHLWHAMSDGQLHWVSAGGNATPLINSLRGATTLSASVLGSGLPEATFDLRGMFDTRVQGNIDECGNYVDPAWQPVIVDRGTTDAGAYFWSFTDKGFGLYTRISVLASSETSASDNPPVYLKVTCGSGTGGVSVIIDPLPIAGGTYTIRSRVDDGAWVEGQGYLQGDDDSSILSFGEHYLWLRHGTTLELEVLIDSAWRAAFDLAELFDTPVQTNFDNCGAPLWPQAFTYVPIVTRGWITHSDSAFESILYRSHQVASRSFSFVQKQIAHPDAHNDSAELVLSCSHDSFYVRVGYFDLFDSPVPPRLLDVGVELDGITLPTVSWTVGSDGDGTHIQTDDAGRLIARLRRASSMTVTIDGADLEPLTFDLADMFNTPIQENLDNCGMYKPGETRELELEDSGS